MAAELAPCTRSDGACIRSKDCAHHLRLASACRFVTSKSVEEDILERAKRKMVLDHLVIQVSIRQVEYKSLPCQAMQSTSVVLCFSQW